MVPIIQLSCISPYYLCNVTKLCLDLTKDLHTTKEILHAMKEMKEMKGIINV